MRVDIYRQYETDLSVIGQFYVDGQPEWYELEPSRTTPVHEGHPCIAQGGPFKVIKTPSPHLGYVTPEVLNVPGRSNIRWHIGNYPKDSLGCSLVAESIGSVPDFVSGSKKAFARMMTLLETAWAKGEEVKVYYHDSIGS